MNYARYLPFYNAQMSQLHTTHPDEFMLDSNNPFGRIPVDQTIEETMNKDKHKPGRPAVQFETRGCEQILLDHRV